MQYEDNIRAKRLKSFIYGSALIALGVILLMRRYDWLDFFEWWHLAPAALLVSGVSDILLARRIEHIASGISYIILAFWLFASMEQMWGLTFRNSWPLLVISAGIHTVLISFSNDKK